MTTIATVKEAILALKDRSGSSVQAINKWIETEKKVRRCVRMLWQFPERRLFGRTCVSHQKVTNSSDTNGDNFGLTAPIPTIYSSISSLQLQ